MNILIVAPGVPAAGSRVRLLNHVEALTSLGHRVDVLTPSHLVARQGRLQESTLACRILVARSSSFCAKLRAVLALVSGRSMRSAYAVGTGLRRRLRRISPNYDVVILKRKRMGCLAADVLPSEKGGPTVIVDLTDSVTLWQLRVAMTRPRLLHRLVNALDLPGTAYEETRLLRNGRFCEAWLSSPIDRDFLQRLDPSATVSVRVVPNVVEDIFFQPQGAPTPGVAVFAADFRQPTNRQSLEWLLREVVPVIPGPVVLKIMGFGSDHLVGPKRVVGEVTVEGLGFVPDLVAGLAEASVIVAPMIAGAGTKNKVLQGLAVGRPVVCTPMAAEGVSDARSAICPSVRVHLTAAGMADDVFRLASNPSGSVWRQLSEDGRDFARANFSTRALQNVITNALTQPGHCSAREPSRMFDPSQSSWGPEGGGDPDTSVDR